MRRKPKPYKYNFKRNFAFFLRQLVGRAPRMTNADKAFYRHRAATTLWSLFCLVIISWVGTNLVLCALTTNVHSGGDMIYSAPKDYVLPIGKELNKTIKKSTSYDTSDSTIKTITFDKYTGNNTYFAGGGQRTLSQA